jgi:hypothetical protein
VQAIKLTRQVPIYPTFFVQIGCYDVEIIGSLPNKRDPEHNENDNPDIGSGRVQVVYNLPNVFCCHNCLPLGSTTCCTCNRIPGPVYHPKNRPRVLGPGGRNGA